MKSKNFTLEPYNNDQLSNLCGPTDSNLLAIERFLAVEIHHRGHEFNIIGPNDAVDAAVKFIKDKYETTKNSILGSKEITISLQSYANQMVEQSKNDTQDEIDPNVLIKTNKKTIKPRGLNQQRYIKRMQKLDINFGIGPAGTGKTYLAIAQAVHALETESVKRIILTRPAVEAGEKLGFLPGDLSQKIDPYLRPMYDALYELIGVEKVGLLIEKQVIEIAPLAFMRGRTLNDAFVILDEAQNTSKEQMKMFLTRIGFNTKAIINGDITQCDLPSGKLSGLRDGINTLANIQHIGFTFFHNHDVVRHHLVQEIVLAYEEKEKKQQSQSTNLDTALASSLDINKIQDPG